MVQSSVFLTSRCSRGCVSSLLISLYYELIFIFLQRNGRQMMQKLNIKFSILILSWFKVSLIKTIFGGGRKGSGSGVRWILICHYKKTVSKIDKKRNISIEFGDMKRTPRKTKKGKLRVLKSQLLRKAGLGRWREVR